MNHAKNKRKTKTKFHCCPFIFDWTYKVLVINSFVKKKKKERKLRRGPFLMQ
jgi:hypothetical protein